MQNENTPSSAAPIPGHTPWRYVTPTLSTYPCVKNKEGEVVLVFDNTGRDFSTQIESVLTAVNSLPALLAERAELKAKLLIHAGFSKVLEADSKRLCHYCGFDSGQHRVMGNNCPSKAPVMGEKVDWLETIYTPRGTILEEVTKERDSLKAELARLNEACAKDFASVEELTAEVTRLKEVLKSTSQREAHFAQRVAGLLGDLSAARALNKQLAEALEEPALHGFALDLPPLQVEYVFQIGGSITHGPNNCFAVWEKRKAALAAYREAQKPQ